MQNKHQIFFVVGVPTSREGGSSRLGQNPKFVKGNISAAPLMIKWRYDISVQMAPEDKIWEFDWTKFRLMINWRYDIFVKMAPEDIIWEFD